ncbi:MAG: outer membrane protein assembly factor BamC, partial [Congregibacter sp.]|nr:outer membrane protein assembly factor BamC [Congregibacter sp.]
LVGASKAELSTASDGQPILRLNLDFDRAWASVTQALDNAEVSVTDLDRSEGVLYVDLPESLLSGEPERRGLFGGKRKGSMRAMQIRVTPYDKGGYQVRAVDKTAAPIEPERAREVLNLIREYAI